MFPHISYSDIVLLAELTSRTLLRLRNTSNENSGLARQVSNLLTAQRKLQERAADPGEPVNTYSIRQDRASIVGGCWKVVNHIDIALERPNGLSSVGNTGPLNMQSLIYDYTLAIHHLLVTTSSKAHVETESHLGSGGGALDILKPAINRLIPTLIARAIGEDLPPCSYVGDSKHVLVELKATMPDVGIEKHMTRILAYMYELTRDNIQEATASVSDATRHDDSSTNRGGGLGFTPSDPLMVFEHFMNEEGTSQSKQEDDSLSAIGPTAEEADGELRRIYETLQDYQAQYEDFVDQTPRDVKAQERQAQVLEGYLERNVIKELDQLLLGGNQQLKAFRKYLMYRAQSMLAKIEDSRSSGSDSQKKRRNFG
ncbi:MAG: hypothetical protein Q9188_003728 [Gyalolechia gomerana]